MTSAFARQLIQRIAVRTQFPPMVWLYRALYAAALWLCVRRLKKVRGVRALYLRRGLASGRVLYGLSDIDLLALVEEDATGRTEAAVRYHYALSA